MLSACSYVYADKLHVFEMSTSRTHACIGTSLAYTSDV